MLVSTTPTSENVSSYVSRYFTEMPTGDFDRKSIQIASRHKKLRTRVKFSAASAKNFFETNFLFLPDTPPRFLTTGHNVFVMKNLKTPDEVCEYLRISRTLLWRMENDRELLPYRFRGKVFYEQADVDAFLDSKKVTLRTLPNFADSHLGTETRSDNAPARKRSDERLGKESPDKQSQDKESQDKESPGQKAQGKKSVGRKNRQKPAVTNGVIAATPISQRSSRTGYFAPVAFGTAVAEIDRRYQRENQSEEDN